uniref:Uncharacterized protein n=1 Tax=Anopheles culicifacies TaxID=139723 RepID=A0A182MC73_9DIPT
MDRGVSNPTIINISNNNHNIMAPPYPYHGPPQYQPKMGGSGSATYKEMSGKYGAIGGTGSGTSGTAGSWAEYATHHHEASVIGNFEAKNPNKYHHTASGATTAGSRMSGGYRYASATDYGTQPVPPGTTGHYVPSHTGGAGAGYGLYHPDGVQATPIQQSQQAGAPGAHAGYDAYPHIVRNKYSGSGPPPGMHLSSGSRVAPSHADLMYNERSQRYVGSYGTGNTYMPSSASSAGGGVGGVAGTGTTNAGHAAYYTQMGPTKGMNNSGMDYYGSTYSKQLSSSHPHHTPNNPYIPPNRMAYASQTSAGYHPHPSHPAHHHVPHPHHKSAVGGYGYTSANGSITSYDDPYHQQRSMSGRVPLAHPYTTDPHHHQSAPGSTPYGATSAGSYHHQVQGPMGYPNPKLTFSKNMNDFYTPNVTSTNVAQHYGAHPGSMQPANLGHAGHYGMKYSSQPIAPQQKHPGGGATLGPGGVPASLGQQNRKSSSCFFDTPSPVIDINHPLIDLEEQINSVKILKSGPTPMGTAPGSMYDTNHPLNYDCQQMYLKSRYMPSKPVPPGPNGNANPMGYGSGQPISGGEHPLQRHQLHHQPHPEAVGAYGGYATMEDLGLGPRSFALDENLKDKSLRDYLTSWSEMEEEDGSSAAAKASKETNNNLAAHQNYESCKYMGQLQPSLEPSPIATEEVPVAPQQKVTEDAPVEGRPAVTPEVATTDSSPSPPSSVPVSSAVAAPVAGHTGVIVANVQSNGNLPDILVDIEKPPKAEETGKDGEKLYILETYDVPQSELNKYKHLSVINELPKNVVPINDSADSLKFLEEIESNREKYYQTELESEVVYEEKEKEKEKEQEVVEENKTIADEAEDVPEQKSVIQQPKHENDVPRTEKAHITDDPRSEDYEQSQDQCTRSPECEPEDLSQFKFKDELKQDPDPMEHKEEISSDIQSVSDVKVDTTEVKSEVASKESSSADEEASFKVPRCFPKYRKRRFYDYDMPRFPKKARRSSIEEFINCDIPKFKVQTIKRSPKSLQCLLVDTLNSKPFRRWAKQDLARRQAQAQEDERGYVEEVEMTQTVPETSPEQLDQIQESIPLPTEQEQETDRQSVLVLSSVPSLRDLCYERIQSLELFHQPVTLKELCERIIRVSKHLYIIEEMKSEPPRLQDLCKAVLSETNIFIDVSTNEVCIIDDDAEEDSCEMIPSGATTPNAGRVFIVEEDRGSIADLLRENIQLQEEDLIVVRQDIGEGCEDHEIFMADLAAQPEPMLAAESENDIFSRVEQEIEKMMHTSSSEDEAEVPTRDSELFAFAEDVECVQYEEVIPVHAEEQSVKEGVLKALRAKYATRGEKEMVSHPMMKDDESQPDPATVVSNTASSPVRCDENSASNCSSSSIGKSSPASQNTGDSSPYTSSGSGKSNSRSPTCSSEQRAAPKVAYSTERPRSVIVSPPIAKKKKKLSFEESLLNIDQMYRKPASPAPTSTTPSLMPRSVTSPQSATTRPNVIVNVNNKREVPRKLIIPSYKIFDQTTDDSRPSVNGHHRKASIDVDASTTLLDASGGFGKQIQKRRTSISAAPGYGRSISSSESDRRARGLERRKAALVRRRSCCCSPLRSPLSSPLVLPSVCTKSSPLMAQLGAPVPYVRLERNDYVEKLAENYRRQAQQHPRSS